MKMIKTISQTALVSSITTTLALFASITVNATVTPFSHDFEGLPVSDGGSALADINWKVGSNVFDGVGTYPGTQKFFYGLFGAPNGGPGFSSVATGDATNGGVGTNYLNVYSDYNCCDLANAPGSQQGHGTGSTVDVVNSLVVQEFDITADDIGKTITFTFDAKRPDVIDDGFGGDDSAALGNGCTSPCTANAFVKTIDTGAGFTTNLMEEDMTSISQSSWETYSMTLSLSDPGLVGQKLQVGFQSFASSFNNTGVYYDNISLDVEAAKNIPIGNGAILLLGLILALINLTQRNIKSNINHIK